MAHEQELLPKAIYIAPDLTKEFQVDPTKVHSADGKTTGPSDFVLNAGAVDKDKPSEPSDNNIGRLRTYLTTLQDDVNIFLTERMNNDSSKDEGVDIDIERRVLDEGAEEPDSD